MGAPKRKIIKLQSETCYNIKYDFIYFNPVFVSFRLYSMFNIMITLLCFYNQH